MAESNDIDLIAKWTNRFQEDADVFSKKTEDQILAGTKKMIASGDLFKWMHNKEIVSIAAIVRKTRNYGIIGLVYTPDGLRGRGYATGIVHQLSERILHSGFNYCGLFTDKANPTSNSIYKKIGYFPGAEFSDIEFV